MPVKPPQSRRGRGFSVVHIEPGPAWGLSGGRVYVKRQEAYWCRPVWRLFRRTPTLRRELRGLLACMRLGVDVPGVVHYEDDGTRATLVLTEVAEALPLDQALARPDADRAAILRSVADAIARLHAGGWSHGALYAAHILVRAGAPHPVVFIDLEKASFSPLQRRQDLNRLIRRSRFLGPDDARTLIDQYRASRRTARQR
jgi:tRNA A-37 threonylcarbamoyl transferase component Bud32